MRVTKVILTVAVVAGAFGMGAWSQQGHCEIIIQVGPCPHSDFGLFDGGNGGQFGGAGASGIFWPELE